MKKKSQRELHFFHNEMAVEVGRELAGVVGSEVKPKGEEKWTHVHWEPSRCVCIKYFFLSPSAQFTFCKYVYTWDATWNKIMREKCEEKKKTKLKGDTKNFVRARERYIQMNKAKTMKKRKRRKDEITDVPRKRGVAART